MTSSQPLPPSFIIRSIQPNDNNRMAEIIRTVLEEFGYVGEGFSSSDAELNNMFAAYQAADSGYFVLADANGNVVGGGGFAALQAIRAGEKICELRKMYFLSEARGFGFGKKLLEFIFIEARKAGYAKIYLETTPELSVALRLYEQLGFHYLRENKGNTGHQDKCKIYMMRCL